jgi:hypothetical protein
MCDKSIPTQFIRSNNKNFVCWFGYMGDSRFSDPGEKLL